MGRSELDAVRKIALALPEVNERLSHGAPCFFIQNKRPPGRRPGIVVVPCTPWCSRGNGCRGTRTILQAADERSGHLRELAGRVLGHLGTRLEGDCRPARRGVSETGAQEACCRTRREVRLRPQKAAAPV